MVHTDVWDLGMSTTGVIDASSAWLALQRSLNGAADALRTQATAVQPHWVSPQATSYEQYVPSLVTALRSTSEQCGRVSGVLDNLVTDLRGAQGSLSASLSGLRSQMTAFDRGATVLFFPLTDDQRQDVLSEIACANQIRSQARQAVETAQAAVVGAGGSLAALRGPWSKIASSGSPQWSGPSGSGGTTPSMLEFGGTSLITGTSGDDKITVKVDPQTGETIVTIEPNTVYRVPRGEPVVINAGGGADRITVDNGTTVHLRFLGGSGDDKIEGGASLGPNDYFGGQGIDSLQAGAGNDYLSGGADRDYLDGRDGNDVLLGGDGNDVAYGMGGDDRIDGGAGNDYLEGATGADQVFGGDGADQVSGGKGDDTLFGGAGADVMLAGEGTDTVHGQDGTNTLYVGKDDASTTGARVVVEYQPKAGEHIEVVGSAEFIARVQADLDMLRSSPVGQHALDTLGQQYEDSDGWWPWASKVGLQIHEIDDNNAFAWRKGNSVNPDGGYAIQYNPDFVASGGNTEWVPVVVLYHEIGHIFQFGDDSWPAGEYDQAAPGQPPQLAPNGERQNVGLPWNSAGVDPSEVQPDPTITENALRRQLGIPDRLKY